MTITTPTSRCIVIKRTPKPMPLTNRWLCREGALPPVYRNDTVKGKML